LKLIIIFILFFSFSLYSQTFGDLIHKGTGCPQGTVSITSSPDNKVLSIIFDSYQVLVPQYDQDNDNQQIGSRGVLRRRNDPTLNHKACALSFITNLPEGQKIDSIDIILNIRGVSMLDQGTEGSFSAALVGYNGLSVSSRRSTVIARKLMRAFHSPIDEDWNSIPVVNIPVASNCAVSQSSEIRFDLKTHLQAEILSQDLTKNALLTVDSIDSEGMIKIKLNTSPCNSYPSSGVNLPPRRRPRML
jgi:hypothetical protein